MKTKLTKQKIYIGVAIFMGLVLLVSMLPIIYCSFFNYASGDDLNFSNLTHAAFIQRSGISTFFLGAYSRVKDFYLWWGGNWVAAILWSLQPSVFGEDVYHITFYVSMLFLVGGTGYFLRKITARWVSQSKLFFSLIFILFSFVLLQYVPVGRTTFFWYSVVANYVFPYGLYMVAVVLLYKIAERNKVSCIIGCSLIMVFIGGTGYMTLVLMLETLILFWIYVVVCNIRLSKNPSQLNENKKNYLGLSICTFFFMASTVFNVVAPGNYARGGERMNFSPLNLLMVVAKSILRGTVTVGTYLSYSRFLFVFVPLLVLFIWEFYSVGNQDVEKNKFKYPVVVVMILFLMYCSTFAPMILMGDIIASSGHTNTYWFAFVTALTLSVMYVTCWLKILITRKYGNTMIGCKMSLPRLCECVLRIGCVFLVLITLALGKHFVGNMFAYTCYKFIDYGYLADYEAQMQERFALLNDDEEDVVLPYMNSEQGPYLFFAATDDPEGYSNQVVARFYGKNSVVGMPRGEFYELYGQQ